MIYLIQIQCKPLNIQLKQNSGTSEYNGFRVGQLNPTAVKLIENAQLQVDLFDVIANVGNP